MKVTVEFDRMDEIEVLDRIIGAAGARLADDARADFERIARDRIGEIGQEVIAARAGELIDEALQDDSIGLATMIMERVRFELRERLPSRTDQLVRDSLAIVVEEEMRRIEERQGQAAPRRRRWRRKR